MNTIFFAQKPDRKNQEHAFIIIRPLQCRFVVETDKRDDGWVTTVANFEKNGWLGRKKNWKTNFEKAEREKQTKNQGQTEGKYQLYKIWVLSISLHRIQPGNICMSLVGYDQQKRWFETVQKCASGRVETEWGRLLTKCASLGGELWV